MRPDPAERPSESPWWWPAATARWLRLGKEAVRWPGSARGFVQLAFACHRTLGPYFIGSAFPSLRSLLGRGWYCQAGRPCCSEGCGRQVWSLLHRAVAIRCLAGPPASHLPSIELVLLRHAVAVYFSDRSWRRTHHRGHRATLQFGTAAISINPDSSITIASCWDGGAAG
jgi:hypothetical protein